MRKFAASAIFLAVSVQASATILSFTAPPTYPDFKASDSFTATQAFGNAGHFFQDWEDIWRLSIDSHAPALKVLVTVPQNPAMSLGVASVWLRGPGVHAELPGTFTWLSTHAGEKRFEMSFDSPPAGDGAIRNVYTSYIAFAGHDHGHRQDLRPHAREPSCGGQRPQPLDQRAG